MTILQGRRYLRADNGVFHVNRNGTTLSGLTGGSTNKITFTTKVLDSKGWFDTSTSNYTPLLGGYYSFYASTGSTYTSVGDGVATNLVFNDFVGLIYFNGNYSNATTTFTQSIATGVIKMNGSTDYVNVWTYLPSTSTTVLGDVTYTYFGGYRVANL